MILSDETSRDTEFSFWGSRVRKSQGEEARCPQGPKHAQRAGGGSTNQATARIGGRVGRVPRIASKNYLILRRQSTRERRMRKPTRRTFLAGAGLAGAGVAMPQVSRAHTITRKYQSTWADEGYFPRLRGRLREQGQRHDRRPAETRRAGGGRRGTGIQMQDAVHSGVLDAGHGVWAYWYGKHKAFSLFGTVPSFGWDSHGLLGWFYHGGGEALNNELVNTILRVNTVGFLYLPCPPNRWAGSRRRSRAG
jgi:hypothetical protein